MARLTDALAALGVDAEVALDGRWATLAGERGAVYVVEIGAGTRYVTWCDHPDGRTVEVYFDPVVAIHAGLQRAAQPTGYACDDE